MRNKILIVSCILSMVSGLTLNCKFDPAYGPAPYTIPVPLIEERMKMYVDSVIRTKSVADSLAKAASILSTAQQAYVDMKFGMFIHFNMSTFDRCCCPTCKSCLLYTSDAADDLLCVDL